MMSDNNKNNNVNIIEGYCTKLNGFITQERNGQRGTIKKPKIQTVPASLRGQMGSEKYYEPRWMSIGPIHHGNAKYKLAEDYKFELAAKFIRNGHYQSCEDLFNWIKNDMAGLDEFFDKEVVKDTEWFNWLLFFDGCAILEFIHCYTLRDGSKWKELGMKNDQVAFIKHDIFLLENQIPFQVLMLLMEARPEDAMKLKESVLNFINMNAMAPPKYQRRLDTKLLDQKLLHLLDLLLSVVVGKLETETETNLMTSTNAQGSSSVITIPPKSDDKHMKNCYEPEQSFRSVTDLKVAGINLKPSTTSLLSDVNFESIGFAGTLNLPPLIVDDLTGSKFLNLIAYEMCPDNTDTEYDVTSYISFLDSLIDYPTDVKELRSSQILHNLLGCDKDVALLFNKIATDLAPNSDKYQRVITKIEKHYKKRLMTWMAQVYNDHFSSPWTIVTFLMAVLALGLAIIDTWLNINEKLIKKN